MRISDWSSDVCSSDLISKASSGPPSSVCLTVRDLRSLRDDRIASAALAMLSPRLPPLIIPAPIARSVSLRFSLANGLVERFGGAFGRFRRSEEHTSELQSLMRISYAVFCLKK